MKLAIPVTVLTGSNGCVCAEPPRVIPVPGGRQSDAAGVRRGGPPITHAHGGVGHPQPRQSNGRRRIRVHRIDPAEQTDLLLQGESAKQFAGLRVERRGVGWRRGCLRASVERHPHRHHERRQATKSAVRRRHGE